GNNIDSGGMEHLLKSIVREYMVRVIKNDIKFCPFTIVNLEKKYKKTYTVNTSEGEIAFEIGGAVDRLDKITDEQGNQILRVVDYKTGKDHGSTKINDIEEMFDDSKEGSDYFRQTSLYSIAIAEDRLVNPQHLAVAPSLYYIRNKDVGNNDATYNPIISYAGQPLSDIENIKADYEEELHKVLHSIFNKTTFDIPADLSICNNCPFAELCQD
ncbi:MAG: PD-(D/E)XK nuclease family protein, partial [Prevotella sp.]|nr:PD-(D/E)XK nuclease family protein [Prevotella sp.]